MDDKNIRNKNLYKIFLSIVKYLPLTIMILKIINIVVNYYGISSILLVFLGGTSLSFLTLLYIMALIFKYCYLYKIPLYYLTISDIATVTSKILTIETLDIYRIHFIISGIFIVIYIVYVYFNRHKINNKNDYIKNLCDRC